MIDCWWVLSGYDVCCCFPPISFPVSRQTCPQEYVGLACLTAAMVGMMQILAPRCNKGKRWPALPCAVDVCLFGQCAVGTVFGSMSHLSSVCCGDRGMQ